MLLLRECRAYCLKSLVMQDLENLRKRLDRQGRGVYVQASTLGSLEALLDFLKSCKVYISMFLTGCSFSCLDSSQWIQYRSCT